MCLLFIWLSQTGRQLYSDDVIVLVHIRRSKFQWNFNHGHNYRWHSHNNEGDQSSDNDAKIMMLIMRVTYYDDGGGNSDVDLFLYDVRRVLLKPMMTTMMTMIEGCSLNQQW